MKTLRWGIVSTGRIAEWFCSDFHKVEGAELVAVSSRSEESALRFAETFSIPQTYTDYSEMLADPTIDCIYIGTPHTLHLSGVLDALNAGKAVLCEKPLVTNPDDCRTLIETAERTNGFFMEAMWTYFLPAMRKAKEWCDGGRIGELLHIKTDFGYPVPYSERQREYDVDVGGGCLLEMGIYPIAIASYFARGKPRIVSAVGSKAPNGVENDVSALLEIGDVTVSIGTSFRTRLPNTAYIIGTEGYIAIPDAFRASECSLYKIDERIDHFDAPRETRGYEYQAISLCADLRAGRKQSQIMPHARSLLFQDVLHELKQHIT